MSAAELGDILTKQGRNKMSEEEVEEMINSVDKVYIIYVTVDILHIFVL